MKRFETWGGTRREGFGGFIRPDGGSCFFRLALAIGIIAAGVGGCAHTRPEPEIRTVETKVAVPVPCHAEVTLHDGYTDALAEFTTDIWQQAKDLLTGRDERRADLERLKGAVIGCGGTVK